MISVKHSASAAIFLPLLLFGAVSTRDGVYSKQQAVRGQALYGKSARNAMPKT